MKKRIRIIALVTAIMFAITPKPQITKAEPITAGVALTFLALVALSFSAMNYITSPKDLEKELDRLSPKAPELGEKLVGKVSDMGLQFLHLSILKKSGKKPDPDKEPNIKYPLMVPIMEKDLEDGLSIKDFGRYDLSKFLFMPEIIGYDSPALQGTRFYNIDEFEKQFGKVYYNFTSIENDSYNPKNPHNHYRMKTHPLPNGGNMVEYTALKSWHDTFPKHNYKLEISTKDIRYNYGWPAVEITQKYHISNTPYVIEFKGIKKTSDSQKNDNLISDSSVAVYEHTSQGLNQKFLKENVNENEIDGIAKKIEELTGIKPNFKEPINYPYYYQGVKTDVYFPYSHYRLTDWSKFKEGEYTRGNVNLIVIEDIPLPDLDEKGEIKIPNYNNKFKQAVDTSVPKVITWHRPEQKVVYPEELEPEPTPEPEPKPDPKPDTDGSKEPPLTPEIETLNPFDFGALQKTMEKLHNFDTERKNPPVIKIPMRSMMNAVGKRFGFDGSSFSDEYILVDFGKMNDYDFMGYGLIDLIRVLISFEFIYITLLYIWRRIVPKEVIR